MQPALNESYIWGLKSVSDPYMIIWTYCVGGEKAKIKDNNFIQNKMQLNR